MRAYLVIEKIPQPYSFDDISIVYVGVDKSEAIKAALDRSKGYFGKRYIDIEVWIDGKDSGEYVQF